MTKDTLTLVLFNTPLNQRPETANPPFGKFLMNDVPRISEEGLDKGQTCCRF